MINPNVDFTEFQKKDKTEPNMNDILVPFLACGDLSGFDAYVSTTENSNKQEIV
jgi:carbon starvation protein CstA